MAANDPVPDIRRKDLYSEDPVLQRLVRHWLGPDSFDALRGRFVAMGRSAAAATPLSGRVDQDPPRLVSFDPQGRRVDRVVHHPDYHELERLSYGAGIIGIKYDPVFLRDHAAHRHLVGFTLGYLFGQTELGLFCPICMTDGVGRVLERHAADDVIAEDTIRHLAATDPDALWQGAMFLTEKQGGSDVGANAVQAEARDGRWFLSGEKWFCSNVDAKAILVLARMPDQPPDSGTRGLGLFLVLRDRPQGNGTRIRIDRLKDKLGVRSMATGEVRLEGVEAHLIGGAGEGFKQMAEMLNMSRLYNAVASTAAMRRATSEALAYGRQRKAFGATLDQMPLWRAVMADLVAETLGAVMLTFETVRSLDAADQGDADAVQRLRILTPMTKATTGKLAVFTCSEAMEAVGGNGYIEDWIFPRLLRDAQVLPIWEGTTNILALDTLRVLLKEQGDDALVQRVDAALEVYEATRGGPYHDAGLADGIRRDLQQVNAVAERIRSAGGDDRQRAVRGWMEHAARTLTKALLLEATTIDGMGEVALAAARRLHARVHMTSPVGGTYSALMEGTESPLLDAWLSTQNPPTGS